MGIDEIALATASMAEAPDMRGRNTAQTVGAEFDAMLIRLLLQAGNMHASEAEAGAAGMSVWNDLFAYSLARELAQSGEPGFSKSLLAGTFPPGGENHD